MSEAQAAVPGVRHAAIIAGGASRRMGAPKALLPVDGVPLIRVVARGIAPLFDSAIVVVASDDAHGAQVAATAQLPCIADLIPGKGPLSGIHAALVHFEQPVFCVACDMPCLSPSLVRHLCSLHDGVDAVVPMRNGYPEPLHAVYAPSCRPAIEALLQAPRVGPFRELYRQLRVRSVEESELRRYDPELMSFTNWNDPSNVERPF